MKGIAHIYGFPFCIYSASKLPRREGRSRLRSYTVRLHPPKDLRLTSSEDFFLLFVFKFGQIRHGRYSKASFFRPLLRASHCRGQGLAWHVERCECRRSTTPLRLPVRSRQLAYADYSLVQGSQFAQPSMPAGFHSDADDAD